MGQQVTRYTNVYFFSLTQDEENKFKNTIYSLRYAVIQNTLYGGSSFLGCAGGKIDFSNFNNEGVSMKHENKSIERLTMIIIYICYVYKYKLSSMVFNIDFCNLFLEKWTKMSNRLKSSIFVSLTNSEYK